MMKAMILAAGRGKRMLELTADCPKPLLKVGEHSLIAWQLIRLARAGVREVVINLAYKGEMIAKALGDGSSFGLKILYSREGEEGLETAGGIIHALPLLGENPFLVVNADVWHNLDFQDFIASYKKESLAHLLLVDNPDWKVKGDFSLAGDIVIAGENLTFAGISILNPRLFAGISPSFLPLAPILQEHIARGEVSGEHFLGEWQDIGTPERLHSLQNYYG